MILKTPFKLQSTTIAATVLILKVKYLSVDCSVQSPPPEIEEFASIREFLQINGPLAMESYLDSQELLLDPTSTDAFDQITFQIRSMMQRLIVLLLKWFKYECKLLLI